ncbi:MAG: O-succinylbenzoic acid--CoA ligase [Marinoscillum sp.]|jgi:O-succinylbenzoic acid--CoA ligase
MFINFKKWKLTTETLISEKINENIISASEKSVLRFAKDWLSSKEFIEMTTSGSTGTPKPIHLTRNQMQYSAGATLSTIDQERKFKSALLCIDPTFIGGKMLMVRAFTLNMDLTFCEPSELVDTIASGQQFDLVSLVPLQIEKLLDVNPKMLEQFDTVLIGGAPMSNGLLDKLKLLSKTRFYQTYGMTETASHIALKRIDQNTRGFKLIGDTQIKLDQRGCLAIIGTATNQEWVQTNDLANLITENEFEWIGRADNVINSGGIKVSPEIVESLLSDQLDCQYFIAGLTDERLGERVVLFVESVVDLDLDYSVLPAYHAPKEIIKLAAFDYTKTGKINRNSTKQKIAK